MFALDGHHSRERIGRHILPTDDEIRGRLYQVVMDFAVADARHHKPFRPHTPATDYISGCCPHLRDRIRSRPTTDYGPDLYLGPAGVYVHSMSPDIRYCQSCSGRALREMGDARVCTTCALPRDPSRKGKRFQMNPVIRVHNEAQSTIHFVVPMCDRCRQILFGSREDFDVVLGEMRNHAAVAAAAATAA